MESSRHKKCPACFSEDVIDTGKRLKGGGEMNFGDIFGAPAFPIYKCYKCNRLFTYINDSEEINNYRSNDELGGMPF